MRVLDLIGNKSGLAYVEDVAGMLFLPYYYTSLSSNPADNAYNDIVLKTPPTKQKNDKTRQGT